MPVFVHRLCSFIAGKAAPYILIGLLLVGLAAPVLLISGTITGTHDKTAARHPHSPSAGWTHTGAFGTYDRPSLQRGFQVYKQVCSSCHSLNLLAYRNLSALGFNEDEVKALASEYQVTDGPDDEGNMFQRPAKPSDKFVAPFANDKAARAANNGALPPDLSLIIKARHSGEDYVYSLLTGYGLTPKVGERVAEGMHYNPYFAGRQIAMPAPLSDGAVTFADGTTATIEQMAKDVVQFLAWASEPEMETRKATGTKAIIFLVIFAAVLYSIKRSIWRNKH